MSLIRPFTGLRPATGRAAEVIAPPYDVLSTEEARVRAAGKLWSFLHISKPEIDLPPGTDPYAPAVYAKGRENLDRMVRQGVLARDAAPCYYVYRIAMGAHAQTGLVAAASVAAYDANRIRKHEHTQPDKETDRVRQIDVLSAQTGPVLNAYPDAPEVDDILQRCSNGSPDADAAADDGIRHTLWVVHDSATQAQITQAFGRMQAIYIADGHHRSAAASRVAAARRASSGQRTGEESYEYFLTVNFPYRQMRILDYNRIVADLNGMNADAFLAKLATDFVVSASSTAVKPAQSGEFGVFVAGRWYRLQLKPGLMPVADPIARLDVSLLTDRLLAPVLGIHDLRRDKRIHFVGGARGLAELERRVSSGEMAAAFSLYPTRMSDLMAVADAGQVMPPKSTWFEPKLADGMVSRVLD